MAQPYEGNCMITEQGDLGLGLTPLSESEAKSVQESLNRLATKNQQPINESAEKRDLY